VAIQLQGGGKGARRIRPTMNVTPLVDVVLVLLIIFMVMTPLMTRVLSVHVPTRPKPETPSTPAPDDEAQVVLTVGADGAAPYGRAVEVLDIARGVGLATIAVLTEELGGS
jgi:biopolymer transport protein ExbD